MGEPLPEFLDRVMRDHFSAAGVDTVCMSCGQDWPCDAIVIVAALRPIRESLGAFIVDKSRGLVEIMKA